MDLPHHEILKRCAVQAYLLDDLSGTGVTEQPAAIIQQFLVHREFMRENKRLRVFKKQWTSICYREGMGGGNNAQADEAECPLLSGTVDSGEIHDLLNLPGT